MIDRGGLYPWNNAVALMSHVWKWWPDYCICNRGDGTMSYFYVKRKHFYSSGFFSFKNERWKSLRNVVAWRRVSDTSGMNNNTDPVLLFTRREKKKKKSQAKPQAEKKICMMSWNVFLEHKLVGFITGSPAKLLLLPSSWLKGIARTFSLHVIIFQVQPLWKWFPTRS